MHADESYADELKRNVRRAEQLYQEAADKPEPRKETREGIVLEMIPDKVTKSTVRYAEDESLFDEAGLLFQLTVRPIYFEKDAIARHFGAAPKRIKVRVEKIE